MSQQKIFITGATGYIGGSILNGLANTFPSSRVKITALVRNEEKAAKIRTAHPDVQIVIGDFNSKDVLEKASEESNIVVHSESDNVLAIDAIIAGLNRRTTPSFLIHTSGTGLIADTDPLAFGEPPTKIWSDISDMPRISTFPEEGHMHRHVDKLILPLSAATGNKIRTAIVCPPDIYGIGTGTGNNQSIMLPMYAEILAKDPEAGAFVVGAGKNVKSVTHILDVVDIYLRLVAEALEPHGGKADWGSEGFYFTATSTVSFPEFAERFVEIAKRRGWLPPNTPTTIQHRGLEDAKQLLNGLGPYMWGSNAVTNADRAKKIFGWQGKQPSWQECLETDMEIAFKVSRTETLKWREF